MPYIASSIIVLAILIVVGAIYLRKSEIRYVEQESKKPNKLMFWIGIAIVAIAVIFFFTAKEEMEYKMWAIPIWIVGIGLISNSRYRFLK